MAHCKLRWFLAVLLPTRHISFFIYIVVASPTRSIRLYQFSSRRIWMHFPSVSRSLWIQSPQEPLSLRCCSPCASLFMKDGPKELYVQMLRTSCIPARLRLCIHSQAERCVLSWQAAEGNGGSHSEIPTSSLRCLPWDQVTFKAVGTPGLDMAWTVIQIHIISVQLKVGAIPLVRRFQSTTDDYGGIPWGCPN